MNAPLPKSRTQADHRRDLALLISGATAIRYISIRFSIWRSLFWRRLLRKHGWQRRRWTA